MALRKFSLMIVSGAALLSVAGCPSADSRTSNQGGGSIITAGAKVAGSAMTTLTADEIQIIGDLIADNSTKFAGISVTDEQAAAAADFLVANDLDTIEEVQALVNNPGNVEIPQSVQALIEAGNVPGLG